MKLLRYIWQQLVAVLGGRGGRPPLGLHVTAPGGVCIVCGDYLPPSERDQLTCRGPVNGERAR